MKRILAFMVSIRRRNPRVLTRGINGECFLLGRKPRALALGASLGFMALSLAGVRPSFAGEIDLLLQKLVDKSVLTAGEAQQIGTETKEQVKREIAQGKYSSLPAWVQNTKLKGDMRLRYQYKHVKDKVKDDTHVGRLRLRLGLESKVNDKIIVGIGMATNSGGDPRSTNITFGDKNGGYSTKMEVRLDYAYAKYMALPWFKSGRRKDAFRRYPLGAGGFGLGYGYYS